MSFRSLVFARNPLFHRNQGRNVLQLTFDDSLDSTHDLECFFQMPTQTIAIRRARVWVQRKSYRAYETAASSGGSATSGSEATHTHTVTISSHSHGVSQNNSGGTTSTDSGHSHNYTDIYAATTSDNGGSSTPTSSGGAGHTHSTPNHTHDLTYAISETAASGTVSLFVADDGTNYGSAITTGATSITDQDITSQLTRTTGDKRIKITATGLMRVQVLVLLDLRVAVFA